jgi:hypothetical protein
LPYRCQGEYSTEADAEAECGLIPRTTPSAFSIPIGPPTRQYTENVDLSSLFVECETDTPSTNAQAPFVLDALQFTEIAASRMCCEAIYRIQGALLHRR